MSIWAHPCAMQNEELLMDDGLDKLKKKKLECT